MLGYLIKVFLKPASAIIKICQKSAPICSGTINVYYIFISVIVCSVSMILRLTVFLTLKQKWQVFKAYMMSVLLHLVTKHGIYNLISHKRRAVIILACQKRAQNHVALSFNFKSAWFLAFLLGHSLKIPSRAAHAMRWSREEQINENVLRLSQAHQVFFSWNIHDKPQTWKKGGGLELVINRLFRFLKLLSSE